MAKHHAKRGKLYLNDQEFDIEKFDIEPDSEVTPEELLFMTLLEELTVSLPFVVEWVAFPLGHNLWQVMGDRCDYVVSYN